MSDRSEPSPRRSAGMEKMKEVYNFSVDPEKIPGDFVDITVDHLFGTIWARPALGVPERRLLTIGALSGIGRKELLEVQFRSALERGEMDEDQVREVVVHLTHYVGWPLGTVLNEAAESVIASRRVADER